MSIHDRDYMRPAPGAWRMPQMNAFLVVFWANIAVFVAQFLFNWGIDEVVVNGRTEVLPWGGVSLESLSEGRIWTIFTFMFVHGSLGHILMNMLFLWFVGKQIYQIFGAGHFLRIYILSGLLGAALEIALRSWVTGHDTYLIGASASVFGLFLALAVTLPQEVITAMIYFVIPVRVRLWRLAMILVGINLAFGVPSLIWPSFLGSNIAYFAHLGGALAGWYYIRMLGYGGSPMTYQSLWRPDTPAMRSSRQHLSLVRKQPRRRPHVEMDLDHANPSSADPVKEIIRDDVDPILDKINERGISSLTDEERRILERASRLAANPPQNPR